MEMTVAIEEFLAKEKITSEDIPDKFAALLINIKELPIAVFYLDCIIGGISLIVNGVSLHIVAKIL